MMGVTGPRALAGAALGVAVEGSTGGPPQAAALVTIATTAISEANPRTEVTVSRYPTSIVFREGLAKLGDQPGRYVVPRIGSAPIGEEDGANVAPCRHLEPMCE